MNHIMLEVLKSNRFPIIFELIKPDRLVRSDRVAAHNVIGSLATIDAVATGSVEEGGGCVQDYRPCFAEDLVLLRADAGCNDDATRRIGPGCRLISTTRKRVSRGQIVCCAHNNNYWLRRVFSVGVWARHNVMLTMLELFKISSSLCLQGSCSEH